LLINIKERRGTLNNRDKKKKKKKWKKKRKKIFLIHQIQIKRGKKPYSHTSSIGKAKKTIHGCKSNNTVMDIARRR
jgi:hypothetical protein